MNVLQSNLTYAAGKLFFSGQPVAGFRSLAVKTDTRVTVFKAQADAEQVKAMKADGIKVWSMK